MKRTRRVASLLMTFAIVASSMILLGRSRVDYCGRVDCVAPRVETVASRWPTLAPPPKTVLVQVEIDTPDLQIGWAEN